MYHKALLFNDSVIAAAILTTSAPRKQKALGQKVSGYDQEVWEQNRERIVEEGNFWKFVKEEERGLRKYLLGTGESILVEVCAVRLPCAKEGWLIEYRHHRTIGFGGLDLMQPMQRQINRIGEKTC